MKPTSTKATPERQPVSEPPAPEPQPVSSRQPATDLAALQAGVGNAALAAAATDGSLRPSSRLLPVQSTSGNAAVDRSIQARPTSGSQAVPPRFDSRASLQRLPVHRGSPLQPKLTVGGPHDPYEQEADRVAEQVLRMPTPSSAGTAQAAVQGQTPDENGVAQTKPLAATITPLVQRALSDATESFDPGAHFEARLNASGGGSPLPANTRAFMEPRFGADFSGVRLHTGSEAAQLTRAVSAQAFTQGQDIYLGEGKSDLESNEGKQLLAHELTHTIQQHVVGAPGRISKLVQQGEAAPLGDDRTPASAPEGGRGLDISGTSTPMIQRQGGPAETATIFGTALAAVGIIQNQFGKPDGGLTWTSDMATYPEDLKVVPGATKPVDHEVALFFCPTGLFDCNTQFNLRGDFGPKTMANVRIELVRTTSYYTSALSFSAKALKTPYGTAEHPKIRFVCSGRFDPAAKGDCTYNVTLEVDENGSATAIQTEIVEGDPELIRLWGVGTIGFQLFIYPDLGEEEARKTATRGWEKYLEAGGQ